MEMEELELQEVTPRENSSATDKKSKRFSVRAVKQGANRVLEEVKNAFSSSQDPSSSSSAPTASPAKGNLTKSESGSLSRKLSLKGLAGSLTGSIKKKLASSLQSILDIKPQKIFGMKLDDLLDREKELGIRDSVPALVARCIEYLVPAHLKEEGLFRLSGAALDIQKMKDTINKGEAMQMLADSPHNVAGLLKLFIRELPEPLIPEAVQVRYLVVPDMDDRDLQKSVVFDLISELPLNHLRLLRVLFNMLGQVRDHSDENKMTASNLATCWAPNLFWTAAEADMPPTPAAAQKLLEFSRQANAVVQFMIEEQAFLFKEREFEKFYSIPTASPRKSIDGSEGDGTPRASKSRKRSRDEMLGSTASPAPAQSPSSSSSRANRRAIRSEMIGSYDQVLAANGALPPTSPVASSSADDSMDDVSSPAPKKRKTSAANIFASAAAAVRNSPQIVGQLGKMVSRRMSERRRTVGPAPTLCLLFYYDDSKQAQALRKILSSASLTPCEIRDETKDPMTFEEAKKMMQGIESIVVVKKNGEKAYTETHPVTSRMSEQQLQNLLLNPTTGKVRAPAIIVGSTFVVGYEKDVEDFFTHYLFFK